MSIASPCVQADNTGLYIGANVGQSRSIIDNDRIISGLKKQGFATTSITEDEYDVAYKAFVGYQLNQYFALEGGYFDLGQFDYTANTLPAGTLNGMIRLRGFNVDAVGFIPFTEKFSAFGRVGLTDAYARDSFNGSGSIVVLDQHPSKQALSYKFGLGLQYDITRSLTTRLEAERYRIDDAIGNKGDIDLLSVGLVYRFNQKAPIVAQPEPEVIPEPVIVVAPTPVVIYTPPPLPAKVSFSADSMFDFDKSTVKAEGKHQLDTFATNLKGVDFGVIKVIGHTDRIGRHQYNMDLSTRRADAVKDYMMQSTGIPAEKISAQGVASEYPVTQPDECIGKKVTQKLIDCLQSDRRVEIEVVGTK